MIEGHLGAMTSGELAAAAADTLLVPLGATEQHGPHLPLETDTTLALAWAEGVAAKVPGTVVAPPLPFGSSGEHQTFPGTLSIGQEALRLVVIELVRSAAHDFTRVVLLSGHGGNAEPLQQATGLLAAEGHNVVHFHPWWPDQSTSPRGTEIDAHAGHTETSMMLHLEPGSVRLEHAEPGERRPLSELMDAMVEGGVGAVSPNGILGDPTGADEASGKRLLDALIDHTVDRLTTGA